MNSFYFDKMHMLHNQNKSCSKSCQNIALEKHCFPRKTHCFPKKPIVFQHVHFFIPLFWNEKLSLHPPDERTGAKKALYSLNIRSPLKCFFCAEKKYTFKANNSHVLLYDSGNTMRVPEDLHEPL